MNELVDGIRLLSSFVIFSGCFCLFVKAGGGKIVKTVEDLGHAYSIDEYYCAQTQLL